MVPTCSNCNLSKGRKGLKEWLKWLRFYRPKKYTQVVEYNKWKRHKIAQAIREVRDEQRLTQ